MKARFRLAAKDEVKVEALSPSGKYLASTTDSGFTKMAQAVSAVLRKVGHFTGNRIEIRVTNITKETYKIKQISVNR